MKEEYTLVTGASRGIGREIAIELAMQGHNLILTAKEDERGLRETAALISCSTAKQKGAQESDGEKIIPNRGKVKTFLCDGGNPDRVRELFGKLSDEEIEINVLINNAGISYFELVQYVSDEDWKRVMAANLDSVFYMTRAVVPYMVSQKKGTIINISSYWGSRGSAMESVYCASKGGVNAFTKSIEEELKPSGIKVFLYEAEFVDTQMNAHLTMEEKEEAAQLMPSKKIFSPQEVAKIVSTYVSTGLSTET